MIDPSNNPMDVEQIRQVIDRWVLAFRDKDVAAGMSIHADEVVAFDIVPPLSYVGKEAYRLAWKAIFEGPTFAGPILIEVRELAITVRQDIAFSRSLNRFRATRSDDQEADYWFRWTACFQKFEDQWLIVHDHSSAPTDFVTGLASLNELPVGSSTAATCP